MLTDDERKVLVEAIFAWGANNGYTFVNSEITDLLDIVKQHLEGKV
jgi:hypothetical protein